MRGTEVRRAVQDLGDTFRVLEMEDTFRDLHRDLREDFEDTVDLSGDPSISVQLRTRTWRSRDRSESWRTLLDLGDELKDHSNFGDPLDGDE